MFDFVNAHIREGFIVLYAGRIHKVERTFVDYLDLRDLETNEYVPGVPRSLVSIY